VTFRAQRSIQETTQLNASGYFSTSGGVSVDHELRRNVILSAGFNYTNNDYQGISREDDVTTARLGARYLLNRNLYLSGGYNYTARDSSVAGADYDDNVVMLRLSTQL
jgi:uncharacterized protein (PEP-CTERM system associated)